MRTTSRSEGLFNAGCMIGNFYSGTYTFAMEGMNYGESVPKPLIGFPLLSVRL